MRRRSAIAWYYSSSGHRTFHVFPRAKNRRGGGTGIRVSNVMNHHDQSIDQETIIMIHCYARVSTKIAGVHSEHSPYSQKWTYTFILLPFELRAQCPIWSFSVVPWCRAFRVRCSGIFRMILRWFLPASPLTTGYYYYYYYYIINILVIIYP